MVKEKEVKEKPKNYEEFDRIAGVMNDRNL
jgi:hypothetical protein